MAKSKTLEETYKKLTQREHILQRPGMYIGSVKKQLEELWVANDSDPKNIKMEKKMIEYSPGFMKIFDEILTNATDHSTRDKSVTTIKVDYDITTGEISVQNNGNGIPIEMHKEHNMYIPELIFGNFLSGSNYDDSSTRTGAGTNGIGSKASNVYSKRFIIETVDSNSKKKFIQEFSNNMTERTQPKITSNSSKSYTKITFIPDYSRFEMNSLEPDTVLLLRKRVIDCIACTNENVQIYLNGEKLKGKGLTDYTKYFFEHEKIISESHIENVQTNNGEFVEYTWEYAIVPYHTFEQVSFVNGNSTNNGGKHVDYILYQIINKLKKILEEKKKLKELKPNFIKDKLFLFLRATVANPSFNSQTKEQLTTQSKDFGCNVTVSDQFINKIYKSSITEEIVEFCKLKESASLSKHTDGKKANKVFIPKLEDALWAGTAKSNQCTLILTEGDSAKTFAMWGRSVVGPERYGCYPLRGKVLNIRDATISQLLGNEEINNLKQILGLKQDRIYKDTSELRYGKIMLLTDSDSVTYDTPCLIKNIETNEIEYKPICEINDGEENWQNTQLSEKEYNGCEKYLIWSDNGWTKIKSVMRHKVNKSIHRVLTHTGCVDVTEDHSLLNKNGNEITVKDIIIKETELCHKKYIQETIKDYKINTELAWAMGYFCADGNCSIDSKIKLKRKDGTIHNTNNYYWSISCVEKEPLEKLQKIFEIYENGDFVEKINELNEPKDCIKKQYKCLKCNNIFKKSDQLKAHLNIKSDCSILNKLQFVIKKVKVSKNSFSENSDRKFKYILEANGTRKYIAEKYRKMFYNSLREKKIPIEIINNSREIQQSFIDGFYAGDGDKGNRTTDRFDGEYKTQIAGLFQVLQNCEYTPSINCSDKKLNVYNILMPNKNGYNRPEYTVKKIINVSDKYKDTYVYDFETENHHFHGSIGNIIVHNCDGLNVAQKSILIITKGSVIIKSVRVL